MSNSSLTRRAAVAGLMAGTAALTLAPATAFAFSAAQAETLITKAVNDINAIINSGKSEEQMLTEFEKVMVRYSDTPNIARSVLGPPARTASASQLATFTKAFQTYISRKYGTRFREFIGGEIIVRQTQKVNSIYDVQCTAVLRGEPPFAVSFIVADRTGKFIDITIEGISLLKSERAEIGALLDQVGGNIDKLSATLR